jgi:hypothetical protein
MSDKRNQTHRSPPVANYSSAIARAVEWLGDRYLLAKPINAVSSRESPTIARPSRWFTGDTIHVDGGSKKAQS